MYLVDANILLYAINEDTPSHAAARDWLDDKLSGPAQTVGLPWPTLLAFVRIATNPRVYARPMPVKEAWRFVEEWLNRRAAWIPVAGPRHRHVLSGVIDSVRPTANLLSDAHLAALAMEHGLTMVSADADFARFDGLRWLNPST